MRSTTFSLLLIMLHAIIGVVLPSASATTTRRILNDASTGTTTTTTTTPTSINAEDANSNKDCRFQKRWRLSLDFSNDNCTDISEFDEAFGSLYQDIHRYYHYHHESRENHNDNHDTINDQDPNDNGPVLVVDEIWQNNVGSFLTGIDSNGGSYSVVKVDDRLLLRRRRSRRRRHLDTDQPDMDCPPKEECYEDWCCMVCGVNCEANSRRRQADIDDKVCDYVIGLELDGCLKDSTIVCSLVQ